jgi:ABC-type transport system involved in cytochrome c biogenesis permease subunit
MRAFRRISLPTHGLVELVAGLALVLAAFALDLSATGTVLTFAAGVLVAGIGLGAADALPLEAHRQLDQALAFALATCSIVAAFTGSPVAALALLAGATLELGLSGATRWTRAPLTR